MPGLPDKRSLNPPKIWRVGSDRKMGGIKWDILPGRKEIVNPFYTNIYIGA